MWEAVPSGDLSLDARWLRLTSMWEAVPSGDLSPDALSAAYLNAIPLEGEYSPAR